jgi:hypothetical protein
MPHPKLHEIYAFDLLLHHCRLDAAESAVAAQTVLLPWVASLHRLHDGFAHGVGGLLEGDHTRDDQVLYVLSCEISSGDAGAISLLGRCSLAGLFGFKFDAAWLVVVFEGVPGEGLIVVAEEFEGFFGAPLQQLQVHHARLSNNFYYRNWRIIK